MKKNILIILITTVVVSVLWQLILVQKINTERRRQGRDYSDCEELDLRHKRLLEERKEHSEALKYYKDLGNNDKHRAAEYARFIQDKEYLVSYFFDEMFQDWAKNSSAMIYDFSMLFNPNHWHFVFQRGIERNAYINDAETDEPKQLLPYLLSKTPRNPESIKNLVSQPVVQFLAKKFVASNAYQNGGENLMRALYMAYHEVNEQPELLEKIYSRATDGHTVRDTIYYDVASEKVTKLLLSDHYTNEDGEYDDIVPPLSKLALVYGFWARRHHEENMGAVFEILDQFVSEVENSVEFDE